MSHVGLGRDNLRSHFVFRPRHAPEWLRARFLPIVFLANEEELTRKTFTTSLNATNRNTYVKFIFLRTSPLTQTTAAAFGHAHAWHDASLIVCTAHAPSTDRSCAHRDHLAETSSLKSWDWRVSARVLSLQSVVPSENPSHAKRGDLET